MPRVSLSFLYSHLETVPKNIANLADTLGLLLVCADTLEMGGDVRL